MLNDDAANDGDGVSQQNKLDEAISIFQLIESVLGGDEEEVPSEVSFEYPVHDILSLLPEHYIVQSEIDQLDEGESVRVSVDDLYQQLKRGKVEVTVSKLCFSIPTNLVTSEALVDTSTIVKMPLQKVVMALNPKNLRERTSQQVKQFRVDGLDDPFARPDVKETIVVDPQAKMRANAEEAARAASSKEDTSDEHSGASVGIGVSQTEDAIPDPFGAPAPLVPEIDEDEDAVDVTEPSIKEPAAPSLVDAIPDPFGAPAPVIPEPDEEEGTAATVEMAEEPAVPSLAETFPDPFSASAPVAPEPDVHEESDDVAVTSSEHDYAEEEAETPEEALSDVEEVIEEPAEAPLVAEIPDPFAPPPVTPVSDDAEEDEDDEADEDADEDEELVAAVVASRDRFEERESFGGVNLNAAGKEELMTLDGVSAALADTIIEYRSEHGPFDSIFDLGSVPRLGRKTFRRITGMPYSDKGIHRRFKLAKLLQMDVNKVSHLPTVAQAVADNTQFAGCLISDSDGMLLAQTGAEDFAQAFSAVLPRIFSQLQESMNVVDVGNVESISMGVDGQMFTSVSIGRICLTAVHEKNKLTKTQLVLISRVAEELSWMLSHRGYVGR
jgi:competence ComEA-like helix-hairpin-helix protein